MISINADPVLIALDDIDAVAWAARYPELMPAVSVVLLAEVASQGEWPAMVLVTDAVIAHLLDLDAL